VIDMAIHVTYQCCDESTKVGKPFTMIFETKEEMLEWERSQMGHPWLSNRTINEVELKVFKVYYQTLNTFKNANFFASDIKPFYIGKTHVFLKDIMASDLESVFIQMQGKQWSPNGEAREFLQMKGLSHTSLMTGDIVYDVEADIYYLCRLSGWEDITDKIKKTTYIYDDRGKSKEEIVVIKVIARHNNYKFVLLENGEVGMINSETNEFISDQREFYLSAIK
jgi:hypothetical protein